MRMRILCVAAMSLAASSAYAANNPPVDLQWGALCNEILAALQPATLSLAGLAFTWLVAKLGPDIAHALRAAHIDQVMNRAIEAGFALVEGAEKGKVLEIPVANEVLRRAAQYLVAQAPGLFKELGDNLGQMLVARLSASGALPPRTSADNLDLAIAAHVKIEKAAA